MGINYEKFSCWVRISSFCCLFPKKILELKFDPGDPFYNRKFCFDSFICKYWSGIVVGWKMEKCIKVYFWAHKFAQISFTDWKFILNLTLAKCVHWLTLCHSTRSANVSHVKILIFFFSTFKSWKFSWLIRIFLCNNWFLMHEGKFYITLKCFQLLVDLRKKNKFSTTSDHHEKSLPCRVASETH